MPGNHETRIHPFDAARAIAAILGIILHSAAGYLRIPISEWPRLTQYGSLFFNLVTCGIHMVRLPIFFFLAGFFAYQLFCQTSWQTFIKNRIKRIFMPLVIFMVFLHLTNIIVSIRFHRFHSLTDFYHVFHNMSFLWYLEYLLFYYLLFLFTLPLIKRMKKNTLLSNRKCFFYTGLTFIFLYVSGEWYWPISLDLLPNIWLLATYGLYFYLGIFIARVPNFDTFFAFKWRIILLGLLLYIAYSIVIFNFRHTEAVRLVATAIYAAGAYFLFISFFAICFKFFNHAKSIMRYLSDASYWIYLSHVFFIFWVYTFFAHALNSIYLQFLVVSSASFVLSLLSYSLFFREKKTKQTTSFDVLKVD